MFKKFNRDESGQSIVLVALMFTILLGFGALALDIGYMTFQRSSLQNAADSAVLAGAMLVPQAYPDTEVVAKMKDYANLNFKEDSTVTYNPLPVIDKTNKTVNITITQNVPKFLSGFVSNDVGVITVKAKAKYNSYWDGEALPFVNLTENFVDNDAISIWGKIAPGTFEVLDPDEYDYNNVEETLVLTDWSDGLKLANGQLGQGQGGAFVESVCQPETTIYVFSLTANAISNLVIDGNKYLYKGEVLDKNSVIDRDDLVLLEAVVDSYEKIGNNFRLDLKQIKSYDLKTQFPDNYISKIAKTTSTLIDENN